MAAIPHGERVRQEVRHLVHRGLGLHDFARAAGRILRRAVPFEGTCLLTIDPATLLPTGAVVEAGLPDEATPRLTQIELLEPDFNKFTALARARTPAASLSDATAGDLDRSLRQRELRRPSGFADELRTVLPDPTGTWATLTLLREARRPHFTAAEVAFVASLAGTLADGVRRGMLRGAVHAGDDIDTGLLVLAGDDTVESANVAADRWLDNLGGHTRLPLAVRAVAARARHRHPNDAAPDVTARVRVRTATGQWVVVRGSVLDDGSGSRVAILLESARPSELAPLIAGAYGLTDRERRITELVTQGLSTTEIGERLHLSAYTVQDHLKSIFDKSGTGSRGELVARLFFQHQAPRLTVR